MYTIRQGGRGLFMDPPFRSIDFKDSSAVVYVSSILRRAWSATPPDYDICSDASRTSKVMEFAQLAWPPEKPRKEWKEVPQNPDLTINTLWRDKIYHLWNHVFVDVAQFLQDVNCVSGIFNPPAHDIMAIYHPGINGSGQENGLEDIMKKVWDRNVLLIPAYLKPGVKVHLSTKDRALLSDQEDKHVFGTISDQTPSNIWYVRRGYEMITSIEDKVEGHEGLAAVIAIGYLDAHGFCDQCQPVVEDISNRNDTKEEGE